MKIALAQINTTVGDFDGNVERMMLALRQARAAGCRLVLYPEMAVTGYPPRDLLTQPGFVAKAAEALMAFERQVEGIVAVAGCVLPSGEPLGRGLSNAAVVIRDGQRDLVYRKQLLPTYDVFDEDRYFDPGRSAGLFELDGVPIGLTICEDIWNDPEVFSGRRYAVDPLAALASHRPALMLNLSASPFTNGKWETRLRLLGRTAQRLGAPVVYCNLVGGNDEMIFDGGSFAVDAQGRLTARAASFAEDLTVVETGVAGHISPRPETEPEELMAALVLGLRDYARKCGFAKAVVGLSGGIDSALTAALAVEALGASNVTGIGMPSRYSSEGSIEDARALAVNLGIAFHVLPIEGPYAATLNLLGPMFAGTPFGVAEENLQARIRGNLLMAWSNKFGALLLSTGNKSETAVGYCTLYGDMAGGLAVISDLLKTQVYAVSQAYNRAKGWAAIPEPSLAKPPSAELRPDQRDTDSLPPYEVLDPILSAYVVERRTRGEIMEMGFDAPTVDRVLRMVDANEYKRRQAAPGLKVSPTAFGSGRRIPIARKI